MATITIQLDPTVERKLREKAHLRGKTLEEYIQQLAEDHARAATDAATLPLSQASDPESIEQWRRELRAWAASHPARDVLVDDSRESIYEGRGQ